MGTLLIAAAALGFISQIYLLQKEMKSKSRLQNVTTGLIAIFCLGIIAVEKIPTNIINTLLILILLLIVVLSLAGYWIPQLSET
ncbi:hypothetical protein BG842_26595 [Haladaptatus sp. W1]|uniref:hypothetical protein n=1 Tax=Haladaptatus sp. W1 TaxID=1897478 RepID=UPI0008496EAC|nr:hypothetical protein [Haladaptatus sp. W1]ODR80571.1 hypothetical protein BG842_03865 [Haladaptatus sp. W1]ODR82074.1 hypothetical protein BG842_26595 [Haladaptatus sp. W1]